MSDHISEYKSRYGWRAKRETQRLEHMLRIIPWSHLQDIKLVAHLCQYEPQNRLYALRQSIGLLWAEAQDCFVHGSFQACIMCCGSVTERCLKFEHQTQRHNLIGRNWTLGRCLKELDWTGVVPPDVLVHAQNILDPRNSRVHAILEHDDPQSAYMGSDRRVYNVGGNAYIIEHYYGDAAQVLENTAQILKLIYHPELL